MPRVATGPRVFTQGRGDRVLAIAPEAVGQSYERTEDKSNDAMGAAAVGTIGVVNIEGPLSYKAGWWFDNYESVRERFSEALATCDLVVLRICSPGGEAAGCFETARAMRAAADAAGKPVIAFSDESCYSAAYALACAADEIYLPESGGVGSVGVLCVVGDWTKMNEKIGLNIQVIRSGSRKADGHPDIPLTADVVKRFQSRVDTLADQFATLVGDSRDMKPAKVLSYQGDVFYGPAAVSAGLADGVMSWDTLLGALTARVADMATKAASAGPKPLDKQAHSRSEGGSEETHVDPREHLMTITELYAALKAAGAAGDAAEIKNLQAQIDARLAAGESAEDDSDDEDADDDEAEDDEADDDEATDEEDDGDDDSEDDDEDAEKPKGKAAKPAKGAKAAKATKPGTITAEALLKELFPNMSSAKIKGKLMALQATQKQAKAQEDRVNKLETDAKAMKVKALVKRGVREGKITPAQKAFWTDTGMRSVATLREFLKSAPVVVKTEETRAPDAPGAAGLNGLENEVMHKLGVDPVAFAKHKSAASSGVRGFTPSYAENAPRARVETLNEKRERLGHNQVH